MIKAIYGKVKLNKHLCPICGNSLLNDSQSFVCDMCGYTNEEGEAKRFKVIVPPPGIRKNPPKRLQKRLLKIQNNKCYWCSNNFSLIYWRNGRVKHLKIHWDHKIPFNYEQTNRDENWAASCDICNLFKSDFLFKTEIECRAFLLEKWQECIDNDEISID